MIEMRIVSLLPSATEIVCALGCAEQLVGISHSCDLPPGSAPLPILTRTPVPKDAASREIDRFVRESARRGEPLYLVDEALLAELGPDLVITQALCTVCAVPEERAQQAALAIPGGARVLSLTPTRLADVFDSVREVASVLGVASRGDSLVAGLQTRVAAVTARSARARARPRVALLEWLDPPFACGHWNPELVRLAGGVEVLGREGMPSRRSSWEELSAARPDVVFVACCGLPSERALRELSPELASLTRGARCYVADGRSYFSRPGPWLVASLELLAHALDPELHPLPAGVPAARRLGCAEHTSQQTGAHA